MNYSLLFYKARVLFFYVPCIMIGKIFILHSQ